MERTYTDDYLSLPEDPRSAAFFDSLPGHIQDQIRARKHRPATYEELVQAAAEAQQVF